MIFGIETSAVLLAIFALTQGNSKTGGSPEITQFEPPFRVRSGSECISVDTGHAAPLFTDFDGDGLVDLLTGQYGGGKLRIYRNVGDAKSPRFDGFTWFKSGEQEGWIPAG